MAFAGGHPALAAPYYVAANTEALVRREIDTIVANTICHFDIIRGFDPNRPLEVDFNNVNDCDPIQPEPTGGTSTEIPARISIYGLACTNLLQGLRKELSPRRRQRVPRLFAPIPVSRAPVSAPRV